MRKIYGQITDGQLQLDLILSCSLHTEEECARQLKASILGILFSSILVKFNLLINKSYDQSIGIVLNFGNFYKSVNHYTINWINEIYYYLRVKFAFDINFF